MDVTDDASVPVKVLALAGSLRAKAYSSALLRAALDLAPKGLAITHYAPIGDLPFFNQDLEDAGVPPPVTAFKAALAGAGALLLVSPEYNSGPSAVLKNAIDWASRGKSPLKGMPVALMTSSPGVLGGARCQQQLRLSLSGIGAVAMPAPDVVVAQAASRFDAGLRLADEATRTLVGDHLARFERFARAIRAGAG
ncbi:MAG: NAD(P)H-dependent oxidoreductase [Acetobacteraceae bacterium]|nr:NAD(P)H-dependent oxidoreductase [Acetobacteraceae bacterium]